MKPQRAFTTWGRYVVRSLRRVTFTRSAAQAVSSVEDGSALPATVRQDLTTAWQASGQADQDFVKWAQDEISHGCSTNDQTDANLRAATTPDETATKYKKAFVALWMSIANQYHLPVYQYSQI